MKASINFSDHPVDIWRKWQENKKFEGLDLPQKFTGTTILAIAAIDERNLEGLKICLDLLSAYPNDCSEQERVERIKFIESYALTFAQDFYNAVQALLIKY